MNPILENSIKYARFTEIKRKATEEEPDYDSYMPPSPIVAQSPKVPLSVGLRTFIRSFAP